MSHRSFLQWVADIRPAEVRPARVLALRGTLADVSPSVELSIDASPTVVTRLLNEQDDRAPSGGHPWSRYFGEPRDAAANGVPLDRR